MSKQTNGLVVRMTQCANELWREAEAADTSTRRKIYRTYASELERHLHQATNPRDLGRRLSGLVDLLDSRAVEGQRSQQERETHRMVAAYIEKARKG